MITFNEPSLDIRGEWGGREVHFLLLGVLLVSIIAGQELAVLSSGVGVGLFGYFFSHLLFLLFCLPIFGRRPDID